MTRYVRPSLLLAITAFAGLLTNQLTVTIPRLGTNAFDDTWRASSTPDEAGLGTTPVPSRANKSVTTSAGFSGDEPAPSPNALALDDLVFMANLGTLSSCQGVIDILRLDTGETLLRENHGVTPIYRLAATPNLTVIVGTGVTGRVSGARFDDPHAQAALDQVGGTTAAQVRQAIDKLDGSLYVLKREGERLDRWTVFNSVTGAPFAHGISVLPDGNTLLVATIGWSRGAIAPPFRVEKYLLSEIRAIEPGPERTSSHRIGPLHGALELPEMVGKLVYDHRRQVIHAVTSTSSDAGFLVHTVDPISMQEVAPAIQLPRFDGKGYLDASISADWRFLVATGGGNGFSIVDLDRRTAQAVTLPDISRVTDVSFNHAPQKIDWLGILVEYDDFVTPSGDEMGRLQIQVGRVTEDGWRTLATGPYYDIDTLDSPYALEWTADGNSIIQGTGASPPLHAPIFRVSDDGRTMTRTGELMFCPGGGSGVIADILTGNGYLSPPSSTPSPAASPSATASPSVTVTQAPSPTPSTVPPNPPSTTPARRPAPLYLPLLSKLHCPRRQGGLDVALVLDASSSMAGLTRAGRTKFQAALEAASLFVDLLRLEVDPAAGAPVRVAVVAFHGRAWAQLGLSPDAGAVKAALGGLAAQLGNGTRLDLAVEAGATVLEGPAPDGQMAPRRRLMVLLTDGMPTGVPTPSPQGSQEDQVLLVARQAKAAGVQIVTIGLGQPDAADPADRIHRPLLEAMASSPTAYLETPDAEGLAAIYRRLALELGCREQLAAEGSPPPPTPSSPTGTPPPPSASPSPSSSATAGIATPPPASPSAVATDPPAPSATVAAADPTADPACQRPLDQRVSTVPVDLPAPLAEQRQAGLPRYPITLAPRAQGGALLSWSDGAGKVWLSSLDADGRRDAPDFSRPGRSVQSLVADAEGGASWLLAQPDELFFQRLAPDGSLRLSRRLVGGAPRDDPQGRWIDDSGYEARLSWTGRRYALLFSYRLGLGTGSYHHSMLRYVEPDGWLVSPGAEGHQPAWQTSLGCVTVQDLRLAYQPASDQLAPVCLSSRLGSAPGITFGRGAFRLATALPIGTPLSLTQDGRVSAELGDLIPWREGYALSYSRQDRGFSQVRLALMTSDGAVIQDRQLAQMTDPGSRPRAPHLVPYGPDLLASWLDLEGRVTLIALDADGLPRPGSGPAALPAAISAGSSDDWVRLKDGSVAWAYPAPDRRRIVYTRLPACPSAP